DVVVAGTGDLEDGPAGRCHPLVLAACDPVGLNVRQTGWVVIVHLAVARYAANAFSRLWHLPHVVRVEELSQRVPVASIHGPPVLVDRLAVARGGHGGHITSASSGSRAEAAATRRRQPSGLYVGPEPPGHGLDRAANAPDSGEGRRIVDLAALLPVFEPTCRTDPRVLANRPPPASRPTTARASQRVDRKDPCDVVRRSAQPQSRQSAADVAKPRMSTTALPIPASWQMKGWPRHFGEGTAHSPP